MLLGLLNIIKAVFRRVSLLLSHHSYSMALERSDVDQFWVISVR